MTSLASILHNGGCTELRCGPHKTDLTDLKTRLAGKGLVMLYFSAHWCPPCRNFTPRLANFYRQMKKRQQEEQGPTNTNQIKDFEVIFVSCDRSEPEFEDYYRSMPFTALPWSAVSAKGGVKEKLAAECCVQGIPSLVILNSHLEIISKDGVRWVTQQDPQGVQFFTGSWFSANRSLYETLALGSGKQGTGSPGALAVDQYTPSNGTASGDGTLPCFTITNAKSGMVYRTVDDLKQLDVFALYFSASWCPPCKAFTPILAAQYKNLVAKGYKFEVIFVSWDKSHAEWKHYYEGSMPWASFDFNKDSKLMQSLASRCGVQSIPTLVTVNAKTGTVINLKARDVVPNDPDGKLFPWAEKHNGAGGFGKAFLSACGRLLFLVLLVVMFVRFVM